MLRKLKNLHYTFRFLYQSNHELMWARIWDDTRRGIPWAKSFDKEISPGRWAVGYNYLYVMTRILNELEPSGILDLGLGISSTLISAYVGSLKSSCEHLIIEQNEEWAQFYKNKHELDRRSNIICLPATVKKNGKNEYVAYDGFESALQGKRFSVISIDGPTGGGGYGGSRRDIVDLLPGILEDRFAIVLDDANRKGERETIREICEVLEGKGINFRKGNYPGLSDVCVIVDSDDGFLCSM